MWEKMGENGRNSFISYFVCIFQFTNIGNLRIWEIYN